MNVITKNRARRILQLINFIIHVHLFFFSALETRADFLFSISHLSTLIHVCKVIAYANRCYSYSALLYSCKTRWMETMKLRKNYASHIGQFLRELHVNLEFMHLWGKGILEKKKEYVYCDFPTSRETKSSKVSLHFFFLCVNLGQSA